MGMVMFLSFFLSFSFFFFVIFLLKQREGTHFNIMLTITKKDLNHISQLTCMVVVVVACGQHPSVFNANW